MSKSPQATLAAIIEDAFRVFARYTCAGSFVVCHCPCCMTEEVEAELVRTPLRQIPSGLLAEYTNSAHGWDDDLILADMRYLLPRKAIPSRSACRSRCRDQPRFTASRR